MRKTVQITTEMQTFVDFAGISDGYRILQMLVGRTYDNIINVPRMFVADGPLQFSNNFIRVVRDTAHQ